MVRYIWPSLIVLVLLLSGASPAAVPAAAAADAVQGDVTCDSAVNAVDSLQILRDVAGLATTAPCLADAGDVNCDASPNSVDALGILRYVAGLNVQTPDGCTPIGDALGPLSPQVLAARLNAAADTGHAEALLRLVYPEIDVGLYTGDGQQILAGAETGPDDFYLYDAESELLARNYVERQLFGLHTVTLFLEEAGVVDVDSGQPLSDEEVLSMLADGVAAARADESLFTWRLIDELGLAQEEPLDLAAPGLDPATTYLDSVQTFLILYDMTLGLPVSAGASAEVSAGGPNARTQALHDYSLLAQGYSASADPVEPTHWKHQSTSFAEERTVSASLEFLATPKVREGFRTGPLRLVNWPAESDVEGTPVSWMASTLIPKNGAWREIDGSRITDEYGAAIVFVPKIECHPGEGPVETKTHTVYVMMYPVIESLFWPRKVLGHIIKVVWTEVEVSRHAEVSGPLAASAADPSEGLPCAYEGTASAVHTLIEGKVTVTTSAQNLRLESGTTQCGILPGCYSFTGGKVTVQVSGEEGGCTWSGGSTVPGDGDTTPLGSGDITGVIILDLAGETYWTFGGSADVYYDDAGLVTGPVVVTCGDGPSYRGYNVPYMNTPDLLPLTDVTALNGTYTPEEGYFGPEDVSRYEWNFHAAECQPSLQPVCQ